MGITARAITHHREALRPLICYPAIEQFYVVPHSFSATKVERIASRLPHYKLFECWHLNDFPTISFCVASNDIANPQCDLLFGNHNVYYWRNVEWVRLEGCLTTLPLVLAKKESLEKVITLLVKLSESGINQTENCVKLWGAAC